MFTGFPHVNDRKMSDETTTGGVPTVPPHGLLPLATICLGTSVLLYFVAGAVPGPTSLPAAVAIWFAPTLCAALLSGYRGYSKTAIPLLGAVPTVAVTVVATYQILFLDPFGELFYLPLFVFLAVGGLLLSGGGYLVGQRVGRQSLT
jgi:hypothetical protein